MFQIHTQRFYSEYCVDQAIRLSCYLQWGSWLRRRQESARYRNVRVLRRVKRKPYRTNVKFAWIAALLLNRCIAPLVSATLSSAPILFFCDRNIGFLQLEWGMA